MVLGLLIVDVGGIITRASLPSKAEHLGINSGFEHSIYLTHPRHLSGDYLFISYLGEVRDL
jgi:hypothetical protein